jgi:hypothetical protein
MRCPACNAENEREATRCVSCGTALARRSSRRLRSSLFDLSTPFSGPFEPVNLPALRAYWVALLGVVPLIGLLLGPAALVMWAWARRKCRAAPQFTAHGPLLASLLLGVAVTVTNWLGVVLMYLGWHGA